MEKYSLDKSKIKVLLLEGIHENAVNYFKENGYTDIECCKEALSGHDLEEKLQQAHIIGIRSRTELRGDVLCKASRLFTIGCFSIGTNQVDVMDAKKLGIPVFNAPFSNTRSVAELVIAECIMLMRGIPEKNALAHNKIWQKSVRNAVEIRGKNLGIIGYGHIGSQVSILAENLGMNVFYYDIEKKLSLGNAKPMASLEELLKIADTVTLHVPSTELTRNMISVSQVAAMKKDACLINASRGDVVDYIAVAEGLRTKHLAGVAADVFPSEPASNGEPFLNELQEFHNVILTPHIGGSTVEAQANIGMEVAEKLVKYSDTGSTIGAVNFVEISLQPNVSKQRFLHIHRNVPGVLREVNDFFSSRGINISAEYLQTDPDIGYVIIETDSELDSSVLKDLKNIEHTIRVRILY
ncbi:MAG: D-3-phosphoglycerate dehydrogenase [Bacteroidetes bacterium RBG_13_43_22]|nr:MAG: D-3-phosphoglycerate dehydrogenase [Bacteroidetes bacterium RBG_13_43_22]